MTDIMKECLLTDEEINSALNSTWTARLTDGKCSAKAQLQKAKPILIKEGRRQMWNIVVATLPTGRDTTYWGVIKAIKSLYKELEETEWEELRCPDDCPTCAADKRDKAIKEGRRQIIEEIKKKGIWGQVPFEVKNEVLTMWCLFAEDWESLEKELDEGLEVRPEIIKRLKKPTEKLLTLEQMKEQEDSR